jgi:hypothetical protein
MGKEITPEEAIALFGRLAEILAVNQERIGIPPMNKLLGTIKQRVFNKGESTDDGQIGQYSAGWAKVRKSRGRQTDYVDLQFEGDLFKSMKTGIDDGIVISIEGGKEVEKAMKMEAKYGKKIFQPSDQEIDKYVEGVSAELDIILKEL